jgi:bisphosphoglycerate-independent phosphoglycerate mutase (AlkP superfamily)
MQLLVDVVKSFGGPSFIIAEHGNFQRNDEWGDLFPSAALTKSLFSPHTVDNLPIFRLSVSSTFLISSTATCS